MHDLIENTFAERVVADPLKHWPVGAQLVTLHVTDRTGRYPYLVVPQAEYQPAGGSWIECDPPILEYYCYANEARAYTEWFKERQCEVYLKRKFTKAEPQHQISWSTDVGTQALIDLCRSANDKVVARYCHKLYDNNLNLTDNMTMLRHGDAHCGFTNVSKLVVGDQECDPAQFTQNNPLIRPAFRNVQIYAIDPQLPVAYSTIFYSSTARAQMCQRD